MNADIWAPGEPDLARRKFAFVIRTAPLAVLGFVTASGALLVSSCWVLPLALSLAGLGGAWLGTLGLLVPYKVHLLAAAIIALAAARILALRTLNTRCQTAAERDTPGGRWGYGLPAISTLLVGLAALSDVIEPEAVQYLLSLRTEG